MGKELINQLQHRNARAAGEPEDPGQEVGLMYRDQAGGSSRRSTSSSTTVALSCPGQEVSRQISIWIRVLPPAVADCAARSVCLELVLEAVMGIAQR